MSGLVKQSGGSIRVTYLGKNKMPFEDRLVKIDRLAVRKDRPMKHQTTPKSFMPKFIY